MATHRLEADFDSVQVCLLLPTGTRKDHVMRSDNTIKMEKEIVCGEEHIPNPENYMMILNETGEIMNEDDSIVDYVQNMTAGERVDIELKFRGNLHVH